MAAPPGFSFRVPPPHPGFGPGMPPAQQQQQQLWAPMGHLPQDWQVPMMQSQAGHLPLGKQLSDPPLGQEQKQQTEPTAANLHRKLQRQLTLNPTYDPRLFHLQQGYVKLKFHFLFSKTTAILLMKKICSIFSLHFSKPKAQSIKS